MKGDNMSDYLIKKLLNTRTEDEFMDILLLDGKDYENNRSLWDERVIRHLLSISDITEEEFEWNFKRTFPIDDFDEIDEEQIINTQEVIGKVKYVGSSFGIEQLTNGEIYDVIGIEYPFIRIIDDSGEDYLYSIYKPSSLEKPELYGKWELIETNDKELKKYMTNNINAYQINDEEYCDVLYYRDDEKGYIDDVPVHSKYDNYSLEELEIIEELIKKINKKMTPEESHNLEKEILKVLNDDTIDDKIKEKIREEAYLEPLAMMSSCYEKNI